MEIIIKKELLEEDKGVVVDFGDCVGHVGPCGVVFTGWCWGVFHGGLNKAVMAIYIGIEFSMSKRRLGFCILMGERWLGD